MTTTSQTSADTDAVSQNTANPLERPCLAPVLIAEQQVVLSTAAATLLRPATTHHRWTGTKFFAAIRHIHIALPEPRPIYSQREASYFDAARMSRLLDHL